MEMERINDNLIKVFIDGDDLEERGVNFLDLISDQRSVERFFYSILEEVDVEGQFHDSEAITFQVIPSSAGIELYISKADFDEMDTFIGTEIIKRLREQKSQSKDHSNNQETGNQLEGVKSVSPHELEEDHRVEETFDGEDDIEAARVVKFGPLQNFIDYAREEKDCQIQGDLFAMNHNYYFVIHQIDDIGENTPQFYAVLKMLDFAESHHVTLPILEEYGQLIRSMDAVSYFGTNF